MKAVKLVCAGVIAATVCVGAAKIKTRADAEFAFANKASVMAVRRLR